MPSPFLQIIQRKMREVRESPAATVITDKLKDVAYKMGLKSNTPAPLNQKEFNKSMENFGRQMSKPADRLLKKYKEVTSK